MFHLQSAHSEEKTLMHTQRTGKRLTSEGPGRSRRPRSPGARGEHTLPSRARARPGARGRKEEAVIVYHRTRDRMPAHDLMMKWLSTVKNVETGSITVEKMKLDEKGFPQPTGEFETLEADSVVLALGQDVDLCRS
jgi:hypothetical protein